MEIETIGRKICDKLWVTTPRGEKIVAKEKIRELRWAILLTKHFTHLLPKVPDPIAAMEQFDLLSRTLFGSAHFQKTFLALKESQALKILSQVLGASKFLWEEFMRTQHAAILPLLENRSLIRRRKSKTSMQRELSILLQKEKSYEGKIEALNAVKDREMFRIDLRHLLGQVPYLDGFARELTDLAETVVTAAHPLAWERSLADHEAPKVSEDKASEMVILALGKFGGRELGFASDIELMFVYSDAPEEGSEWAEKSLMFYSDYVRHFRETVRARSEGIFEIDLRLKPYGKMGSLATSLELFKRYYRSEVDATSLERQALVKLRPVAGSLKLGREIEKLRDGFVYNTGEFDVAEALHLRNRQRNELVIPGVLNAKYSAGGLLDIE
jgi:glutamate-ammonia-ligase adenylyltransferase